MKIIRNILFIILFFYCAIALAEAKSTFQGDRLREACIDYIYGLHGKDAEVTVNNNIDDEFFDEEGITAKCTGDKNSLRGNCYVGIEFRKDDRLIRRVEVPARIKIYGDLPAAEHTINGGDVIDETSVIMKKAEITNYKENELLNYWDIIGRKAKRNIAGGTVITGGLLENGIIIRRGDKVRIIAQSGAVRISSTGKALQDAAVGQTIRIQRDGTRNIMDGYVARDGSIYLSQK